MDRASLRGGGAAFDDFNFNDSALPNPWSTHQPREDRPVFRGFAHLRDTDLLEYMASRNISEGFLAEIDQFFRAHPEISSIPRGRDMIKDMNDMPALQAYRLFLRGYTRPARYVDGIISTAFTLPPNFQPPSVYDRQDIELQDFFSGFDTRNDILDGIDRAVADACAAMSAGLSVSSDLKRLVCYACWGNPIDAFKWYQYHVQEEHMRHRYLPEHVVLNEIPKSRDYTTPSPLSSLVPLRHARVRALMARSNDQGVDVIDVLLSEYRLALVRKGFRRYEIDDLCQRAKVRLDNERRYQTGRDIVDMVMDDAVNRQSMWHRPAPYQARAHPAKGPGRRSAATKAMRKAKRNLKRAGIWVDNLPLRIRRGNTTVRVY